MLTRRAALFSAAAAALLLAVPATAKAADDLKLPRQKVELVAPPFVHAHEQATKQGPKIMEFTLTIEEKKVVIDDKGTTFQAMTFNGSMPGPLMVVHEGDYVELTLVNPATNTMPHNIDFHSATGALGGGALTLINPGEQVTLRWKATRTGTFVYHCAPGGPMIPWHVVSGMNGAVMVLPRDGLTDGKGKPVKYDRVYYIGEQDLYVPRDEKGNFKSYDSPGEAYTDTVEVMRKLIPTHVVFNGKAGALTGNNAMNSQGRRDRADRPFAGQSRQPAASDRRPWRLCLGDRQILQPAGDRARDLVHPRRLGGGCALQVPAARRLRLCHAQSDRGRRARRHRPLQGRRQVERRSDDPGEGAGGDSGPPKTN